MMFNQKSIFPKSFATFTKKVNLNPVKEFKLHNEALYHRILFPYLNNQNVSKLTSIVLSFRFRSIEFNKKRALPFFFARELLTHRKCVASLSQRNIQSWKIRKGRLVGCKVTLRRDGFIEFLDTLSLTIPRMEKFQPTRNFFRKYYQKTYQLNAKVVKIIPNFTFTLSELILFYPIEFGLGLHPDVQHLVVNFMFSSFSVEERFFLLRSNKIPVLN